MKIYKSKSDQAIISSQWYEPYLRNVSHLILKSIPEKGRFALDVGYGTGRISFALAKKGYNVLGIDINNNAIRLAKGIAQHQRVEIDFQLADFTKPGLVKSEFYDVVVCSEVLEHIENYLSIEKHRLGDRLKLDFSIDPETRDAQLPPFSLMPLIENAIKHSIQQSLNTATLTLKIQKQAGALKIVVGNPWEESFSPVKKSGHGLSSLKKRLANIYGDKAVLAAKKDNGNFTITLQIPLLLEKADA